MSREDVGDLLGLSTDSASELVLAWEVQRREATRLRESLEVQHREAIKHERELREVVALGRTILASPVDTMHGRRPGDVLVDFHGQEWRVLAVRIMEWGTPHYYGHRVGEAVSTATWRDPAYFRAP